MIINGKEIKINRENAVVSVADTEYYKLCKEILDNGLKTNNRTGIDTKSIAGYNFKIDISKCFPILETKKVVAKNFSSEIQWIHQEQSNKVKWLHDRENHVWDEWVVDDDGIYRIYEQGENAVYDPEREVPLMQQLKNPTTGVIELMPVFDEYNNHIMVKSKDIIDNKSNPRTLKCAIWFGIEYAETIGEAYGFINSKTHSPQRVEYTLKHNPFDRRMNISLWQDDYIVKAVLPSCVWSCEFKVTPDGKLHIYVHQRSADIGAGLPFNVPQYALLAAMFAKAANLELGTLSWSIMDAHIYENQEDAINKQMRRYEYMVEASDIIRNHSDEDIENLYNKMVELYNVLHNKARLLIKRDINKLKMSEILSELKLIDSNFAKEYEDCYEQKICFEHMLLRENPVLELDKHDSIFEYSTEYVKKDDKYLLENPIGNKELRLKKYHHTPFIKMPIAQ